MHSTVSVLHEPAVILKPFNWTLVFARSRVFKLAGKTHYSNVSFRIGSIISTGLSALAFTSSPVLAFTGKLPYSGSYLKTRVSQGK